MVVSLGGEGLLQGFIVLVGLDEIFNHRDLASGLGCPDFDSLKIPFFLRSDNQYIVKSADFSG